MSAEPNRVPGRFRGLQSGETVEALADEISALVRQRQALRERGASSAALERNRVKIARSQWRLSHALIARYLSDAAGQTAA